MGWHRKHKRRRVEPPEEQQEVVEVDNPVEHTQPLVLAPPYQVQLVPGIAAERRLVVEGTGLSEDRILAGLRRGHWQEVVEWHHIAHQAHKCLHRDHDRIDLLGGLRGIS
jgi:hypothetical protein